ncbi:hypothetical protein QBC42DRAFT_213875, partial [Cladorrhinum samala]
MMKDVFGAPYSDETISWKDEQTARGTFSILTTCVITLALCIGASLCVSLPSKTISRSESRRIEYRIKWLALSIFTPEYLVFVALSQHQRARKLCAQAKSVFKTSNDAEQQQNPVREHPWTMAHSYWAMSGGIAADLSGSEAILPGREDRPVFTANGVSLILRLAPELLPDLSKRELLSRKPIKSGHQILPAVVGIFALVQAVWFLVACIGRIAYKLPLSQLEVITFAHVVCTLIIFALTWDMPFGTFERTHYITDDRIRPLVAYSWMSSEVSARPTPTARSDDERLSVGKHPEISAIRFGTEQSPIPASSSPLPASPRHLEPDQASAHSDAATLTNDSPPPPLATTQNVPTTARASPPPRAATVRVTTTEPLPGTGMYADAASPRWHVICETTTEEYNSEGTQYNTTRTSWDDPAEFVLQPADVARWRLTWKAFTDYKLPTLRRLSLDLITTSSGMASKTADPASSMPGDSTASSQQDFMAGIFTSALYGVWLALGGWNSTFPEGTRELLLWRIASLIVAGTAGFVLVMTAACLALGLLIKCSVRNRLFAGSSGKYTAKAVTAYKVAMASRWVRWPGKALYGLAIGTTSLALTFIYWPCRVYLVWEGFRTLGCLPPEAYEGVAWVGYLPHVS